MYTLLVIILILLLVGGLPHWGPSQRYELGYFPSSILGLVLVVVVILLLMGRL